MLSVRGEGQALTAGRDPRLDQIQGEGKPADQQMGDLVDNFTTREDVLMMKM